MITREAMVAQKDATAIAGQALANEGKYVAGSIFTLTSSLFAIAIFAADEVSRRESESGMRNVVPPEFMDSYKRGLAELGGHVFTLHENTSNGHHSSRCTRCGCGREDWARADKPPCPGKKIEPDMTGFRAAGVEG